MKSLFLVKRYNAREMNSVLVYPFFMLNSVETSKSFLSFDSNSTSLYDHTSCAKAV